MGRRVVMDDVGHRWFELSFEDVAEILSYTHVIADLLGRRDRWLAENFPGYTMTGLLTAIEAEGGVVPAFQDWHICGLMPDLDTFKITDTSGIRIRALWPWSRNLKLDDAG